MAPRRAHLDKLDAARTGGALVATVVEANEAGLLFVCWVRDLDQYETIKGQMVGTKNVDGTEPGQDEMIDFVAAPTGIAQVRQLGPCDWLEGPVLGVWRAGAVFVVLDPAYPAARLAASTQEAMR